LFARQGVAPMNLRAVEGTPLVRAQPMGQSLCETWIQYVLPPTTNVTSPLLKGGGGGADGGLPDGITPHYPAYDANL